MLPSPLIKHLIFWWFAKNLHFFTMSSSLLLCVLLWVFPVRTTVLSRGRLKQNQKTIFREKFNDISGYSPFSEPKKSGRKSCCLPDTTMHFYWKIMGCVWDRVIKLRLVLQNIPSPIFCCRMGLSCWAECWTTAQEFPQPVRLCIHIALDHLLHDISCAQLQKASSGEMGLS